MVYIEEQVDTIWNFRATRTKFGLNAIKEIGSDAQQLGATNVLIVSDKGISKAGLPEKVGQILKEEGITVSVWDEAEPEPSIESVQKGAEFAKADKYDCFIGLGGGSSIDSAKVIALIATHGGEAREYLAAPIGMGKKVPGPCKPLIAVPTTAGTGAENSASAIMKVTVKDQVMKIGIGSPYILPVLAVLDPLLTMSCPPRATADSGMDALVHAIECYVTRRYTDHPPMLGAHGGATEVTDLLAGEAIRLIGKYLRRAVYNGHDTKARTGMLLGAYLSGMAFTNGGLGSVHGTASPLATTYHVAHGLSNAIMLPVVMKHNFPAKLEKFAEIAVLLGEKVDGLSKYEAASKSVDAVIKLVRDVGIPNGIAAIGAKEEDIPLLADRALKMMFQPRPISTDELKEIYRSAMKIY